MSELWMLQLAFILRILLAGICGAVIGYERKNRLKEAGIRTHLIVALGAALIMIISKYGFADILGKEGIALDPSRIAAQIVTGVGFLGAGMIFMRKNMISGLTTAAGIWATSGIGMAIGSGLYMIGIISTLIIVIVQILLHGKWVHEPIKDEISFLIDQDKTAVIKLKQLLEENHIDIESIKVSEQAQAYLVELSVKYPDQYRSSDLLTLFQAAAFIKEIEV